MRRHGEGRLGGPRPPRPAPAPRRRRRRRARPARAHRGSRAGGAAAGGGSTIAPAPRPPPPRRTSRTTRPSSATATCPCRPTSAGPTPPSDRERYQTVYAREAGSVAAPTAGLHFTPALLDRLAARGIERAELVLHVGPGTFRPVEARTSASTASIRSATRCPEATAAAVDRARAEGRRVVAVGTTATRALESALGPDGRLRPGEGETSLVIVPGFRFRAVDALVTNFHLPRSSLLLLVSAFAGRERVLAAYAEAVRAELPLLLLRRRDARRLTDALTPPRAGDTVARPGRAAPRPLGGARDHDPRASSPRPTAASTSSASAR